MSTGTTVTRMRIVVVEDDAPIRSAVKQGLTEAGHAVYACDSAAAALDALRNEPADVVVLDVMLPDASGFDLLDRLRQSGDHTPVIMLTALGTVDDRVRGLAGGADDYVTKPFHFAELLARIEALHRRSHVRPTPLLTHGDVSLDTATRMLSVGQRQVELTPTESSLLEVLLRNASEVVDRSALCEHVWGFTWTGNTNVIEVHINRLRQKLDPHCDAATSVIQTIRGRGYAIR